MSKGPLIAGYNRRILVPSLSQELSTDSSDDLDSSDSDENSSPTQTSASNQSSTSSASDPSSSVTSPEKPIENKLIYRAETIQTTKYTPKPSLGHSISNHSSSNLQRVAKRNNLEVMSMDLSADGSTESSPSLGRQAGHSYVNMAQQQQAGNPNYSTLSIQPSRGGIQEHETFQAEDTLSKSSRNGRYPTIGTNGTRKSRSRERPMEAHQVLTNPRMSTTEQIRERERELERIHRRSRELIMNPRMTEQVDSTLLRARDPMGDISPDRMSNLSAASSRIQRNHQDVTNQRNCISPQSGVNIEGWRPVSAPVLGFGSAPRDAPPPLPPRIHSPPPNNNNNHPTNGNLSHIKPRYKSPSPGLMSPQRHPPLGGLASPPPPEHGHGQYMDEGMGSQFRRRIQSPQRRDFKDFSRAPPRDYRSPIKQVNPNARDFHSPTKQVNPSGYLGLSHQQRSYFEEDEDSGADSLTDQPSCGSSCNQHHQPHQTSSSNLALVPFRDHHRQIASPYQSNCCGPVVRSSHCCCHHHHHPLSTSSSSLPCAVGGYNQPVSKPPLNLETRLVQLEGDKDSLRLQVAVMSDQIESQNDKISDLEKILDDKKDVLRKTEDILQREMLTRSSLETQKLELMSELSNIKLRQAAIEKENQELRKRLARSFDLPPSSALAQLQNQQSINIQQPSGLQQLQLANIPMFDDMPGSRSSRGSEIGLRYAHHAGSDVTTSLQTFGTLPRRSKKKTQSSNAEHRNSSGPTTSREATSAPLETHFYYHQAADSQNPQDQSVSKISYKMWPRKLSNAHSGSAPSLVSDLAVDRCEDRGRNWNQSGNDDLNKSREDASSAPSAMMANRAKEIKKLILGKMRRSNSGNLQDEKKKREKQQLMMQQRASEDPSIFARGGFNRSSAGSRFSDHSWPDPSLPFKHWKVETVCSWMEHLGLFMYTSEVKKHVQCGDHLLQMSAQDLEGKLGIKNSIHRKKLRLALRAKMDLAPTENLMDMAGRLDYQWVIRWLDDVGLPQYKDRFLESRLDGRMLHLLSVGDLFHMRITNMLHHLSIKSGIQVLRQNLFSPNCLKRRSLSNQDCNALDPGQDGSHLSTYSPQEVALWTNHRVMEWLRAADLSEYAPNLRGSGVHGALIIYEPRFTADLLAALLSIPSSKTLLRRHLSLRFNDLVGKEVMQTKRDVEREPHFQVLTPTAKVKPQRQPQSAQPPKSQFTLTRKKRCYLTSPSPTPLDEPEEDLLCPLGSEDYLSKLTPEETSHQHNSESSDRTLVNISVDKPLL